MKIISLSILISITLNLSLCARVNPFEPTDHFLKQKEMIMQKNAQVKMKKQDEEQEKIAQETKIVNEKKQEKEQKKLIDQKLTQKGIIKNAYIPEVKENFKVLPFVKIFIVNDLLTIKVDKKYKLLNQDILKPQKKLLFDFQGKVSFYTIRKNIINKDFTSFVVGTHLEDNFFRVVIDLPSDVIDYIEKIDNKSGIITIQKK